MAADTCLSLFCCCRAVTLNPDIGDFWAFLYTFELQTGTPEQQAHVVKRCTDADPHHGEIWCRILKDPANSRQPTESILKKAAAEASKLALG